MRKAVVVAGGGYQPALDALADERRPCFWLGRTSSLVCNQRDVAVVDERFVDKGEMESAFRCIGDVDNVGRFAFWRCVFVIDP
jgi:hypothetical protein